MRKMVGVLTAQWAFLLLGAFMLLVMNPSITGKVVEQNDDVASFAPPYDAFNGKRIILLSHNQIDENNFHVDVDIDMDLAAVYPQAYYYQGGSWHPISLGSDWLKNRASASIEDQYTEYVFEEGDDFFVAVWVCKGVNEEWKCGCREQEDCGYWHVQGIDLEVESETPPTCIDNDGDGYGDPASTECFAPELDCDDSNAAINPSELEIAYNNVNDDCNASTADDDIDQDGFISASDCDDNNPSINPDIQEICQDGIDSDCSGSDAICQQCGEGSIPSTGCLCQGVASYSGFCCDNTQTINPCGTPEVVFYDGFESGTANTWDYLNPTSVVNQDLPHSGAYSLDLRYESGGGELRSMQYAQTNIPSQSHLYARWFVYFEEDFVQPVNGVVLNTLSGAQLISKRHQGSTTTGQLRLLADQEQITTGIIQNGRWYCLEEEINSDTGFVRIWLDDNEIFSENGLFTATEDIDEYVQGGNYADGIANLMHILIDDVVLSKARVGC